MQEDIDLQLNKQLDKKDKVLNYILTEQFYQQEDKITIKQLFPNSQIQQSLINATIAKMKSYKQSKQQQQQPKLNDFYSQPFNKFYLQKNFICHFSKKYAQFCCSYSTCISFPFICQQENCKCLEIHKKCKIIQSKPLIHKIYQKLQLPQDKNLNQYFQSKNYLFEYMSNRLSQQRQIFRQWYKDQIQGKKGTLYVYGFNKYKQRKFCHLSKLYYSNNFHKASSQHKFCGCSPLQININFSQDKSIQIENQKCFKKIMSQYSKFIEMFDQFIQETQHSKMLIHLNAAQKIFVQFLINKNNSITNEEEINKNQKQIISGFLISKILEYLYSFEKRRIGVSITIQTLRQKWQKKLKYHFHDCIQGKIILASQFISLFEKNEYNYISKDFITDSINKIRQFLLKDQHIFKNIVKLKHSKKNRLIQLIKILSKTGKQKIIFQYFNNCPIKQQIDTNQAKLKTNTCLSEIQDLQQYLSISLYKQQSITQNIEDKLKYNVIIKMKNNLIRNIYTSPSLNGLEDGSFQDFVIVNLKKIQSFQPISNPSLRKFHIQNQYKYFIQSKQLYISDLKQFETGLKAIDTYLQLNSLPSINSLWIDMCQNVSQDSLKVIKQKKKIKKLVLGYYQNSKQILNQKLIKILSQQQFIQSLSTIGILNIKQLNFMIKKNKKLKEINIINPHSLILSSFFELIFSNCKDIQFLNISSNLNQGNLFQTFYPMKSLKVLNLKNCFSYMKVDINLKNDLAKALQHMNNLIELHMNSERNLIVDKLILKVIGNHCKNIQILNIQGSQAVQSDDLQYLKDLKKLKVFMCGYTFLNGQSIVKLSKYCQNIEKLSLRYIKQSMTQQNLLQIHENLRLTHLDLRYCSKIRPNFLLNLKKLQTIFLSHAQLKKNNLNQLVLKSKKIKVIIE